MKIAVLADVHLGHKTHAQASDGTNAAAWQTATKQVADRGYDACVIAGDLFHNGRPVPEDLLLCYEGLIRMVDAGCDVVIVTGNHEWIGVNSLNRHRPPSMLMSEIAGVSAHISGKGLWLADSVWLSTLPWTAPGAHMPMMIQSEYAEMLADTATDFDAPKLMVGHAEVDEALPFRGSEAEMCANPHSGSIRQADIDYPDGYGLGVLGHIHNPTQMSSSLRYVGSLEAYTFADENRVGAWLSLELDNNKPHGWRTEHVQCGANRFATINMDEDCSDLSAGTRVRVRIRDGESALSFDESEIAEQGLVFAGFKDERSEREASQEQDAAADDHNETWTTAMLIDKWVEREQLTEREERLYRDAVAAETNW